MKGVNLITSERDPVTHLALSSRNAYLSPFEREAIAPTLHAALQEVRLHWEKHHKSKSECIAAAKQLVECKAQEAARAESPVEVKLDYVEMNDPDTFDVIPDSTTGDVWNASTQHRPILLSGAMWVGQSKTRLIDNIILGDATTLGILPH